MTEMDSTFPHPDHHTPRWMLRAHCREAAPGEFFPSDGVGVEHARKVCGECPVRVDCLEYALTYRIDHGVWGGCSERERRRILRQRRLTSARAGRSSESSA
jgi:WhiB family redox-sensing transcriptional regulator